MCSLAVKPLFGHSFKGVQMCTPVFTNSAIYGGLQNGTPHGYVSLTIFITTIPGYEKLAKKGHLGIALSSRRALEN